jgi:hypothetical protein
MVYWEQKNVHGRPCICAVSEAMASRMHVFKLQSETGQQEKVDCSYQRVRSQKSNQGLEYITQGYPSHSNGQARLWQGHVPKQVAEATSFG